MNEAALYFYECSGCGEKIPVTTADPDPVVAIPGPSKFEWVFLCGACAALDEVDDEPRDVGSGDFGDDLLSDLREGTTLHVTESDWPELHVTRDGANAIFEFSEHIYTKYWEHKYHARTFCDAMLRAIRRLANEGAPFFDPELEGDDDVHIFVRWKMRLDADRPARESLLTAREAYDAVWQRANAILDDSDSVLVLGKDTHMARIQAPPRNQPVLLAAENERRPKAVLRNMERGSRSVRTSHANRLV